MKKLTLTFAVLCALGAWAYAGPEPLASGKEMKQVVPQPPACPNWSGFYIGAFGGYKYGVFDPSLSATEDESEDARAVESRANDDISGSGGEAGGLIGYNFQVHNWVLGLEAAGGYLWLRNSEKGRFAIPDSDDIYALSTSFKTNYLLTVGPRIGYALCKWLPYVTGGMALGNLDFSQEISETDDWTQRRSKSEDNVGWFVGGGLQYALTNHWSVRAQYQYIDLGDVSLNFNVPDEFTASSKIRLREHNANVAVIFGF
ncbi:MAG: outer membrane beta-barrel protein [Verrucomicrobiota bacterium]